jgi:multidrug efflux pump subunit AcrA (membrane-fusion protein)
MMKKKSKRGAWILVGAALAAAGGAGYAAFRWRDPAKSAAEETATVEKRVMDDIIEVSGHLKARVEQEIRAPAAGIVESVEASAGARLSSGAAIARMDSSSAAFEVDKLAYQIEQERFAGNRRKVELLERELDVRRRAVEDLTLRAHIDGLLSRIDLKPGDVVKEGESYGRIIDVSALVADVEIGEADIPRAKVGQGVEFRFPAMPGLVARGRVASFPAEARVNPKGLVVLDAKLVIDSPPPGLLPAYSFDAVIKAGESREALVADSRAVSYKQGKPRVERRAAGGGWEEVAVETEGFGAGLVRIVAGCSEGDVLKIPAPAGAEAAR